MMRRAHRRAKAVREPIAHAAPLQQQLELLPQRRRRNKSLVADHPAQRLRKAVEPRALGRP